MTSSHSLSQVAHMRDLISVFGSTQDILHSSTFLSKYGPLTPVGDVTVTPPTGQSVEILVLQIAFPCHHMEGQKLPYWSQTTKYNLIHMGTTVSWLH